jgi:hypothetical protein
MFKRIVPLALAGYALWQWQQSRNRRLHGSVGKKPEEVTTWEGEGGALHQTGAQLGPEPTHSKPIVEDARGGPAAAAAGLH